MLSNITQASTRWVYLQKRPGLFARDHVSPKFVSQSGYVTRTSRSGGARPPCLPFIRYSASHAAEGIFPGPGSGAQSQWLSLVRLSTPQTALEFPRRSCYQCLMSAGSHVAEGVTQAVLTAVTRPSQLLPDGTVWQNCYGLLPFVPYVKVKEELQLCSWEGSNFGA